MATTFPDTVVFRGYAAPVRAELDIHDLEVIGAIPPRSSTAPMYVRNSADHTYPPLLGKDIFLNGDGMIHQRALRQNGHADLKTRYVRKLGQFLQGARRAAGRALFGALSQSRSPTTPERPRPTSIANTANTSVMWHRRPALCALKEAGTSPTSWTPRRWRRAASFDFARVS